MATLVFIMPSPTHLRKTRCRIKRSSPQGGGRGKGMLAYRVSLGASQASTNSASPLPQRRQRSRTTSPLRSSMQEGRSGSPSLYKICSPFSIQTWGVPCCGQPSSSQRGGCVLFSNLPSCSAGGFGRFSKRQVSSCCPLHCSSSRFIPQVEQNHPSPSGWSVASITRTISTSVTCARATPVVFRTHSPRTSAIRPTPDTLPCWAGWGWV